MFTRPCITGRLLPLLASGLISLLASSSEASDRSNPSDDWALGPMLNHFPLTLDEGERTEALGPFFYEQQRDPEHTFAIPPFFSHVQDSAVDSEEYDFVYPLLSFDRYGTEYRWHFFQLLNFSGGQRQGDLPVRRFTVFPLYFQQRSPEPDLNYTALFPFYGHLKNRLFKDEIAFTAFPAYAQTRKRDVITDNYAYPLFHRRHGNGLEGWQLWPIFGREQKLVTTKTNSFGELEVVPGHNWVFAGWPFYLNHSTSLGTENPQQQLAVLPFYASLRSPNRDSTSIGWPLFTWTEDRVKNFREWDFPWPLMVIARGEGKTITRFFPFYSQAHNENLQSDFYLWPLYKYNRVHIEGLDRERKRILLFLYSRVNERLTKTGEARTRTDFWPLFQHRRQFNGNTRLQVLAPIEPILPQSKSIERNWSPVWSVWRAEKNPQTGHASQSLLWNLYRRESTPVARKCSLLFGLFQYESDAETSRSRLFFIPLNKTKKDSGFQRAEASTPTGVAAADDLKDKPNPPGFDPAKAAHVPEHR